MGADKQKLLHTIISNLGENWFESGVDANGKAYAQTESTVAKDGLLETLYNLGYEEYYDVESRGQLEEIEPDYQFEEGTINEVFWCVTVHEL